MYDQPPREGMLPDALTVEWRHTRLSVRTRPAISISTALAPAAWYLAQHRAS